MLHEFKRSVGFSPAFRINIFEYPRYYKPIDSPCTSVLFPSLLHDIFFEWLKELTVAERANFS